MRETEWLQKDNGELSWGSSCTSTKISKKKLKKQNKKFNKKQRAKRAKFMSDFPQWHTTDKKDFSSIDLVMGLEERLGNWTFKDN